MAIVTKVGIKADIEVYVEDEAHPYGVGIRTIHIDTFDDSVSLQLSELKVDEVESIIQEAIFKAVEGLV